MFVIHSSEGKKLIELKINMLCDKYLELFPQNNK